jgi:hypothetical protein
LHVACRAAEPHHADANSQADAAHHAFSKEWANLKAALELYFAWYNFCRVHKTLRMTPAMAAGIADHIWTIHELLGVSA